MTRRGWQVLGASLAVLGFAAFAFNQFILQHEEWVRGAGWKFHDPVMTLFPTRDVSVPIFSITYGAVLLYIALEFRRPHFASKAILSYGLLVWLRLISLSLVPLKAPDDVVLLHDPFLNNLIYPGDIVSDLFFSGHIGLLSIFYFLSRRWIFSVLAGVLAILLMIQRIHYSIDIVVAVPVAFGIVWLVEKRIFPRFMPVN